MKNTTKFENNKLVDDFKSVIADAEALLSAASDQTGDGIDKLRITMKSNITNAKDRLMSLEEDLMSKAKDAVKASDEYIQERPYQSALIAGGVELVIGYLLSTSRK